jgi:hypothetical protein
VLPATLTRRFGGLDGLWLHYGPIATDTTPLVVHRAERADPDRNVGALDLPTRPAHLAASGLHLDLYCLEMRPGPGAVRHVQSVGASRALLWCVYAVAWRDPHGAHVTWKASDFGLPNEGYAWYGGPTRSGAERVAEFTRLEDLISGGAPRRGRPPRWHDPSWREIADRADQRKRAHPSLPWDSIAKALNVTPSSLRAYRRLRSRDQDGAVQDVRLLDGGAC